MSKTVITPPGTPAPIAPFSPGTLADCALYVSGTLPFDEHNNVVHVGDAAAQTRHVLETIKRVVHTAGGPMDDVTFNMIFLTDWANYAPTAPSTDFQLQQGLLLGRAMAEPAHPTMSNQVTAQPAVTPKSPGQ